MSPTLLPNATRPGARHASRGWQELIVDNFAGGGGASLGIERATGRAVDVSINHDASAVAMHSLNHPASWHVCESVWKFDPVTDLVRHFGPARFALDAAGRITAGVGLAWFSPDCFPAGTLVLTVAGYRPIEQVREGDRVLTHRGRWRPVTATMTTARATLSIRAHGHPGLRVSAEHPLYVVNRKAGGGPEWTMAGDVLPGNYLASPVEFERCRPEGVPDYRGLWYVAGKYLADGWTRIRDTNAEMVLTVGKHNADRIQAELAQRTDIRWGRRETETATQFTCYRSGLVAWLRDTFGHLAQHKTLPGWFLGEPEAVRRDLFEAYASADGWTDGNLVELCAVSRSLAFGVKSLGQSLGHAVSVFLSKHNGGGTIDGRTIMSNFPAWRVKFRRRPCDKHRQTWRDDRHEFCPVREVEPAGERPAEQLFNISVGEDESYVVEGYVAHNCRHFSRAKGGKPVSKRVRGLAWVVVRWAKLVRPRVILLENVREFEQWGPIVQAVGTDGAGMTDAAGRPVMLPCRDRRGQTFRRWVAQLRRLGYAVEWRLLDAADYGAPTHRRRLFLVARRDGRPIVWPERTHGPAGGTDGHAERTRRADPYQARDASQTRPATGQVAEAAVGHDRRAGGGDRRQQSRLTPYRTAASCIDWSVPCPSIFDRKKPLAEKTLRRIALGLKRYVLDSPRPFIVKINHGGEEFRGGEVSDPLTTVTGSHGHAVVVPTIVGVGGRAGQSPATAGDAPVGTVTAKGDRAVVAAHLTKFRFESDGSDLAQPMPTVTAGGNAGGRPAGAAHAMAVTAATLVQTGYGEAAGQAPRCLNIEEPLGTVTGQGNKFGLVYAFLTKFFGTAVGQTVDGPMHTVTGRDRFGVVTVQVDGVTYAIADIGMRMLSPRELARAQGFPDSYLLTGSKANQVQKIGNSVCPIMAEVMVRANSPELNAAAAKGVS